MQILLLFTNLRDSTGGIPHYNQLLKRAVEESCQERAGSVRALTLHDEATPDARCQGFQGRRWAFAKAAIVAAREADVVIFGHVHFAPLAWAMPRARKCLVLHGIEVWDRLSWWRRLAVGRMDRCWSVSRYTRDRLVAWSRIDPRRIDLLPNTLAPQAEERSGKEPSLPSTRILLTVSRLDGRERYKGIDQLLDALTTLPDAFLVVVGDGSDRPRLESWARKNGIAERVRFTGAITDDELQGYYEACDVFVLPSTGEGFGIVFLEAMAKGKPCVAARAGGVPDVIEDGVTGRLVPPGDTARLADALRQLASDTPERRRLGAAGKKRFDERFSYLHFRERLDQLLFEGGQTAAARAWERCA